VTRRRLLRSVLLQDRIVQPKLTRPNTMSAELGAEAVFRYREHHVSGFDPSLHRRWLAHAVLSPPGGNPKRHHLRSASVLLPCKSKTLFDAGIFQRSKCYQSAGRRQTARFHLGGKEVVKPEGLSENTESSKKVPLQFRILRDVFRLANGQINCHRREKA